MAAASRYRYKIFALQIAVSRSNRPFDCPSIIPRVFVPREVADGGRSLPRSVSPEVKVSHMARRMYGLASGVENTGCKNSCTQKVPPRPERLCLPIRLQTHRFPPLAVHGIPVRALLAPQALQQVVQHPAHSRHVLLERLRGRVLAEAALEHIAQVHDDVEEVAAWREAQSAHAHSSVSGRSLERRGPRDRDSGVRTRGTLAVVVRANLTAFDRGGSRLTEFWRPGLQRSLYEIEPTSRMAQATLAAV